MKVIAWFIFYFLAYSFLSNPVFSICVRIYPHIFKDEGASWYALTCFMCYYIVCAWWNRDGVILDICDDVGDFITLFIPKFEFIRFFSSCAVDFHGIAFQFTCVVFYVGVNGETFPEGVGMLRLSRVECISSHQQPWILVRMWGNEGDFFDVFGSLVL